MTRSLAEVREVLGPRIMTESELMRWGQRVGSEIEPPLWVDLEGPLGAGKSVLARSIIRGAGVEGHVPSPSFTLVQEYTSPRGFRVHHVDLFRLRPGEDMAALGWEELMATNGLVLLEWPERAGAQRPSDRWAVSLDYADRPQKRRIGAARLGVAPELIPW